MLDGLKSIGDFFGALLNKILMLLPQSSFTASDVTAGIDTFNESHFLNYLNWFIPIGAIVDMVNLWLVGLLGGLSILLLSRLILKKFGG